ncbi:MAG: DUF4159 domain-containing protein [Lentisphaerae bacterium]|nr:DUF4159 domain-containing protein [Lentisphaerota bacterium]MBT5613220.1 DUF4159 domain-containing protein [Lentisphaerota bacterium]MBT7062117.1 DUF4159 domain-containing protein [Lentisphaerota bacterium]MBT7847629.1 DUF4159 domain-containing protein [Lentisphaerota bacterium]
MRRLAGSLLFAGVPLLSAGVTDQDVARRIGELIQSVSALQQPDGRWDYPGYPVGATALALMALRLGGIPATDGRIQAGAQYIMVHTDQKVYSEGLVPCALELTQPNGYMGRIRQSVDYLVSAQAQNGAWTYGVSSTPARGGRQKGKKNVYVSYDNSNTQFAILGLAAAERCGLEIPDRTRELAIEHWRKVKSSNGGWSYRNEPKTYPAMTCAGIASLDLLGVQLARNGKACGEYKYDDALADALNTLNRQLDDGIRAITSRQPHYTLYALERVGMLLDLKTIGRTDWYQLGADYLINNQVQRKVAEDALSLLFLAKGAIPIAIAKWRWGRDWNNDRLDVKHWVDGVGALVKQKLDWVPSRLDSLNAPAAKASMVFVNGHRPISLERSELMFLRAYLEEGGTLVAEACCGKRAFLESFNREITTKLFPGTDVSFRPIKPTHPVCTSYYKLTPRDIGGRVLRAGCQRRRVILLTRDISCTLNGEAAPERETRRVTKVATNLLVWAMASRAAAGKLDGVSLAPVRTESELLTADQVRRKGAMHGSQFRQAFGRIKHKGDWLADISFFQRLNKLLKVRDDLPVFDTEVHVGLDSADLFHVAIAFMTGHDAPNLGEAQHIDLRTYLQNGGFLLASSCCSSPKFDAGFRRMMAHVLPNDKLEPIPETDLLWTHPFACREMTVFGSEAYGKAYRPQWGPLLGVRRGGRWIVLYSPVDLCCGIEGDLDPDVVGYRKEESFALLANALYYVLAP